LSSQRIKDLAVIEDIPENRIPALIPKIKAFWLGCGDPIIGIVPLR
jgi:hypothetical protein